MENNNTSISKDKLLAKAKSLATPIDFDELISQNILEKKGGWYKIIDMNRLPEHAKDKITEIRSDGCAKFSKATKSAQKLVDRLSG